MSKVRNRLIGILLFCFILFLFFSKYPSSSTYFPKKEIDNSEFYLPGEFESQDAVWMSSDDSSAFRPVRAGIIREIMPYVKLHVVAQSEQSLIECKNYLQSAYIDVNKINFQVMTGNDYWMRDHGATFVINKNGGMKAIDFGWAHYGYNQWLDEYYKGDTAVINSVMATLPNTQKEIVDSLMAVAANVDIIKSWVNIEGGSLEVNGKGTLILNEPLTLGRNKGATKKEIEDEFKRVLGVTNVIWVLDGLVEDPLVCDNVVEDYVAIGTGGHTDEYLRFSDPNTILLAWVSEEEKNQHPVNRLNYERMSKNYEILRKSRDQDGKPFKIIKVPLPNPISTRIRLNVDNEWDGTLNIPELLLKPGSAFKAGDSMNRLATASYLNYFVTNKVVLLPTYQHAGTSKAKEMKVKSIFNDAFPDRSVIFINALPLNWRGGGMHCALQHQPSRKVAP
ncbi:MAG: agmatine deiminase family protein [Saprospiraceae bacterium]|nr:agmatine deiminase family protein [Saprospiraceae bacterium]